MGNRAAFATAAANSTALTSTALTSTVPTGTVPTGTVPTGTTSAPAAAPRVDLPRVDLPRLPLWFFGFEGVLAAAFDIIKAFPQAWPALVVVGLVNIAVSLTVLRSRLKLAKALWRGKGTRKVALGLVALRVGSHLLLGAAGLGVTSTPGHLAFALVMAALTVGLLACTQRVALRALGAA